MCHLFAHLLICIFQACLEPVSGGMEALLFVSVMWHGETLYGLGVQGVKALILLGGFFFCQVWFQCLSKIFYFCCFCPLVTILDPAQKIIFLEQKKPVIWLTKIMNLLLSQCLGQTIEHFSLAQPNQSHSILTFL
jgi:hypothetical protein